MLPRDADALSAPRSPAGEAARRAPRLTALAAVPVCLAISGGTAFAQTATPSCTSDSGGYDCTIAAGNYTQPLQKSVTGSSSSFLRMDDSGTFDIQASTAGNYGLNFFTHGNNGYSSDSGNASMGDAGAWLGAYLLSPGAVTFTGSSALTVWQYAVLAQSIGGDGGSYTDSNHKYNGANGASAVGGTAISANQPISVRGSFPQGVTALEAEGLGGNGGYGASGGSGGWGGPVQIQNFAPVSIGTATSPANGSGGAIGIAAISQGGNPGNSEKNDESTGGAGGPVSVSDSAAVGVYWVWQGSGPAAGSQLYGILAQSAGAANTNVSAEGKAGGRGGDGQNATITLIYGGNVSVVGQNSVVPAVSSSGYELRPALTGAGVAALSLGAVGGPTGGNDDNATAGAGGAGGVSGSPTYVNIYAAQVSVQGNGMAGVEAQALAGAGGSGNYPYQTTGGWDAHGGNGGTAYDAQIILSGTSPAASVSTAGSVSPGLLAVSAGGDGGAGGTYTGTLGHDAGDGGNAGAGGNASVTVSGSRVSTSGDQSGGIVAISQGGAGGNGGDRKSGNSGDAGGGGNAGAGGDATVDVQYGSSVTTNGNYAPGVVAVSLGGAGGNGGSSEVNLTGSPRPGGNGGASGVATATLESGATISTSGANSPGLVAVSGGGNGGTGNSNSNIGNSQGGDGGAGGNGGRSVNGVLTAAIVSNAGSIITLGDNSPGMVAQGASGAGGAGGNVNGISGESGDAGPAGTVGSVSAANNAGGSISTSGTASVGMLAQSLGGNGGDGGTISYTNIAFGGSGSTAANAGLVSVSNAGSISTTGVSAMGILAQSIGGGGGDTAGADELIVVGGDAAGGGAGGTVNVSAGGSVATAGDLAPAILAQSIGGGGGTAGDVTGVAPGGSLAIGGNGGGGGNGGAVTITGSGLAVSTAGSNALGIAAESAGGGGGNGGAAYSLSVSVGLGAAVAIGGSGGDGGAGGAVAMSLTRTSIVTASSVQDATDPATQPYGTVLAPLAVDSYGIVAQSVGGGGGVGGSSLAKAFVQDVPIPDTSASVAVSGTYSAGGTGGGGGAGGSVAVNLTSGVSVLTYGAGAHGLVAESIGGGGGAGGDSSATSSTFGFKTLSTLSSQKNYNLDVTVSLGGTGGNGGAGGPVSVTLGGSNGVADAAATTAPVQLTTLGDYADAVFAQSVGGGGGNAGFGAGSTQNGTSSGTALKLNVTLGATGGGGGAGGAVNVYMFPGAVIQTYGDSSDGIAAQSVGGGGGNSSGGSIQVGLPSANTVLGVVNKSIPVVGGLSSSVTLKLGQTGGTGGNGGAVNVQLSGASITTGGQDAAGIFAQSVGDGGGTGGSAGSTGSSDDPTVIQDVIAGKKFANSLIELINAYFQAIQNGGGWKSGAGAAVQKLLPSLNFALSLGGTGGAGGDGGAVSVNLANSVVSTSGDYSDAVKLQSVGGGGGAAGSAVAGGSSGLGAMMKLNANVALGASGGSGGNGGQVSATLSQATLSTQGYAAYGLFAQSVGQGGGTAGSAQANSGGYFTLGAAGTVGGGSSGGNGGAVSVQVQTPDGKLPALAPTTISTAGQYAHGVFLQSIGGGGGTAGDGYTLGASIPIYDVQLSFGAGGSGTAGAGGAVSLNTTGGALNISTAGASAYGVLAQSIGGGGGVTFTQPGMDDSDKYTYRVGGAGSNASGGTVSVTLGGSRITTTGDGSHAVFAQSVGGGGGIVGFAPGTTLLYEATASDGSGSRTSGNGGAVTVDTTGAVINTSGASAYGVFAQSVGAGGGVKSNNAGTAEIAGTTGAAGSSGSGGLVTVTAGGPIFASGANAVGIFAQSVGQTTSGIGSSGGVNITVTNNLQGGSGNGWAIWIDTDNTTNHVTISAPAYVHSLANLAIDTTGYGITTVDSWGKVSGSVDLTDNNATAGTFNNYYGATLVPAGTLSANVMNAGLIAPSLANNYATVPLVGNFTQTATGVYAPNVQFATRQADVLAVSGNATLAGSVRAVTQSVLPRISVPILTVAGTASGTLTALPSPLFGYTITTEDLPASSDPIYLITNSSANFEPAGAGFSRLQSAVARHLLSVWNAGGNAAFGTFFAQLDTLAGQSMGGYANLLADLAPQAVADLAARSLANLQGFADNLDRCRRADGATRIVQDGRCAWFQFSGGVTSQSSGDGVAGFGLDQVTWAIGGETRVAPNLYLNGALAYQSSWLKTDGGAQKGSGQSGYAGAGLRYDYGHWSFSGGVFGSVGSYSTTRYLSVLGQQSVIDGSPSINSAGGRLGVAYTFDFGSAFIRPRLTLDGIYVGAPGYTESGSSVDVLNVRDSSQGTFAATPAIEFGKQVALQPDLDLRMSLTTGVSVLSNSNWTQYARFAGAPPGASDFATVVPMDSVAARVGLGLELVKSGRYSLRAEYDGAFSEHANVNGGSIAFHAAF